MGVSLVVSFKITWVRLKGCETPITITVGPEGSVMSVDKVVSTPAWLVWADWYITDFSKYFPRSARTVVFCWGKCHFMHLLYRSHVFLFVCLRFRQQCFVYSRVCFTTIMLFVFVPTLLLLLTCAYSFVGNFCTVEIILIHLQVLICKIQYPKVLCVLCNILVQVVIYIFQTGCILHWYNPM